jgi:hypothetical protein
MHEFLWLDHLPNNQLEGGIELANRLHWNITWAHHEEHWYVWSGEGLLLKTDSQEVAEAFLDGLGLAYAVFPDGIFQQLEQQVNQLVGE